MPLSAEAVKMLVALLVTVLITVAMLLGGQTVMKWREGSIQNEQRGAQLETTGDIIEDGTKQDADRAKTDTAVTDAGAQFQEDITKAETNEPQTLVRTSRAVPDSVRNAFRARRLARERARCNGSECPPGPAATPAPER